jgi:ParB family chromosome partitioning protein
MNDFARTQEDLAGALGKSRSHVANMIRLLALPEPVKGFLRDGRLTAGHARALLNAEDPSTLAQQVVTKGLNVRQTEKLATDKGGVKSRKPKQTKEKDSDTLALERDLARVLGLRVEVEFLGRGGHLVIHYDTLDQLDDILYRLNNPSERHRTSAVDEGPLGEDLDPDADDMDIGNAAFAASFGRRAVADTATEDLDAAAAALEGLEGSVDSWAAELNAEIASEKEELLSNPYADEEGEFQLDPEDEDAPEAVEEAAEEPAQADEVDALLEASADAWGDSLQAETEAETAALTAGWDDDEDPAAEEAENAERVAVVLDDETEGPAAEDDVDALLDASADAWGDLLAEETEAEREALLADLGDDEETSPPQGT